MPNIQLDYAAIEATSNTLNAAADNTVPVLNELRNNVNNLLQNGLVFQQSSPALQEAYEKFNSSLLAAMEGIKGFAKQFMDIRTQMENMDGEMASSIRSAK